MWWKIYYWILLILLISGYPYLIQHFSQTSIAEWRGVVEGVLILLAVYSIAYKKRLFSPRVWSFIFAYIMIIWTLDMLYFFAFRQKLGAFNRVFEYATTEVTRDSYIISVILSLPGLNALYKLTERKIRK